jgi:hypothetical protein
MTIILDEATKETYIECLLKLRNQVLGTTLLPSEEGFNLENKYTPAHAQLEKMAILLHVISNKLQMQNGDIFANLIADLIKLEV